MKERLINRLGATIDNLAQSSFGQTLGEVFRLNPFSTRPPETSQARENPQRGIAPSSKLKPAESPKSTEK